ncbi:MAG: phosphoadenylyl-sulfate reductase [Acetobacteraceae bacterium]
MSREAETTALLRVLIGERFAGRIALVSSFGAESAVLLHLVAGIDPTLPVIFLDTGQLFAETLAYRDRLVARFGLRDVRTAGPGPLADPAGTLWREDPDRCCGIRKVQPLEDALAPFDAWISGRKRYHGGERAALSPVEFGADWRIRINPLAAWSAADIAACFAAHDLPAHPLLARGYRSIGCAPCTRPVGDDEAPRAGRWAGQAKSECGIHRSPAFRDQVPA